MYNIFQTKQILKKIFKFLGFFAYATKDLKKKEPVKYCVIPAPETEPTGDDCENEFENVDKLAQKMPMFPSAKVRFNRTIKDLNTANNDISAVNNSNEDLKEFDPSLLRRYQVAKNYRVPSAEKKRGFRSYMHDTNNSIRNSNIDRFKPNLKLPRMIPTGRQLNQSYDNEYKNSPMENEMQISPQIEFVNNYRMNSKLAAPGCNINKGNRMNYPNTIAVSENEALDDNELCSGTNRSGFLDMKERCYIPVSNSRYPNSNSPVKVSKEYPKK